MAPEGGSGVKRYFYPSGELKEETHWNDYDVVRMVYYEKSGTPLMASVLAERRAIQLTLSDDGYVTEIFQSANFTKDGYCFILEHGMLRRILKFKEGALIRETVLASSAGGAADSSRSADLSQEH